MHVHHDASIALSTSIGCLGDLLPQLEPGTKRNDYVGFVKTESGSGLIRVRCELDGPILSLKLQLGPLDPEFRMCLLESGSQQHIDPRPRIFLPSRYMKSDT